jgi:hypothetical protein
MSTVSESPQRLNLREQVESLLPNWRSWYPSLFDAAADLGLIRARVCAPSSLLLSNRHAAVQAEGAASIQGEVARRRRARVAAPADPPAAPARAAQKIAEVAPLRSKSG